MKVKFLDAVKQLIKDAYDPVLDLRQVGEGRDDIFSIHVDSNFRASFRYENGVAAFRQLDLEKYLDDL